MPGTTFMHTHSISVLKKGGEKLRDLGREHDSPTKKHTKGYMTPESHNGSFRSSRT